MPAWTAQHSRFDWECERKEWIFSTRSLEHSETMRIELGEEKQIQIQILCRLCRLSLIVVQKTPGLADAETLG
jgi:hypothetical protein